MVLRRDGYECRECRRYGRTTQATTVHHIYPLEFYPELAYVDENLISLCNKCHEEMHNRMTNELTNKGKFWKRKVKKEIKRKMSEPPS